MYLEIVSRAIRGLAAASYSRRGHRELGTHGPHGSRRERERNEEVEIVRKAGTSRYREAATQSTTMNSDHVLASSDRSPRQVKRVSPMSVYVARV